MIVKKKLKVISLRGSNILKYLTSNNKIKFKEIYFSEVKKGYEKGWNFHLKTNCYLAAVYGKIKITIFDKKLKTVRKIVLDRKNFSLLKIPKKNWFKYESLNKLSILVNSIEIKHSDKEIIKKDCYKFKFPE